MDEDDVFEEHYEDDINSDELMEDDEIDTTEDAFLKGYEEDIENANNDYEGMLCPNCGERLAEDNKICPVCGIDIAVSF